MTFTNTANGTLKILFEGADQLHVTFSILPEFLLKPPNSKPTEEAKNSRHFLAMKSWGIAKGRFWEIGKCQNSIKIITLSVLFWDASANMACFERIRGFQRVYSVKQVVMRKETFTRKSVLLEWFWKLNIPPLRNLKKYLQVRTLSNPLKVHGDAEACLTKMLFQASWATTASEEPLRVSGPGGCLNNRTSSSWQAARTQDFTLLATKKRGTSRKSSWVSYWTIINQ